MKQILQKFWRGAGWKIVLFGVTAILPTMTFAISNIPQSSSINNPIASDSFAALLELVLNIIIDIGLPIIVIAIIWVGFKYVRAQGNTNDLKDAHQAIKWVLVGSAIVIGAKVITAIIQSTIETL